MTTATFYIIEPDSQADSPQGFQDYVLYLLKHFVSQGARIYLHTDDRQDAESWDDFLFQQDNDAFIPHNLTGEGPRQGTPVEIGFLPAHLSRNRNLLINVSNNETNFARSVHQVVDFVPCDEKAKHTARERYKIYRQAGYQMQTITIKK
ncbi:DNA polymerase III chi subunit [Vibrio ishigakensis]|uniref:DNA polymerase III chi subunit n=1 Tax=Vibrio ishigakensis TaxID=1481914 RepID=A0A0B8NID3_9VIBR|nr:DNA polymerase III subunit chi [Vibrio ishigakensis]GAM54435.1 DNA polymerase III chi subunit [Vibrio ishigakensis]GAM67445.1 DNA polymerase III chi subunit [Vibrio sp. JCM 19236]